MLKAGVQEYRLYILFEMLYCSLDIDVFSKFKKSPDTLLFNLLLERTFTLLIRLVCKIVSVETARTC